MSAPVEMITFREFARRDGCDEKLVRNGVKSGALPNTYEKRLPADLTGTGWRARNRIGLPTADSAAETAPESAAPTSLAEAQRRREIALARLRRHEWKAATEKWVPRAVATEMWREIERDVRTGCAPIAVTAAPLVVGQSAPSLIQEALRLVVYGVLEALSRTGSPDLGECSAADPPAIELELPDTATKRRPKGKKPLTQPACTS